MFLFGALPTLPGDDGGQVAESIAELARGANYVQRVIGEACEAACPASVPETRCV